MKRIIYLVTAALLLLSLCGCSSLAALLGTEPEPTPEPTPAPRPLSETDKWALNIEKRYNMDYSDFGEYWSLMCDGYFGESLTGLVELLSDCENVPFTTEEYNAQIEARRAEYAKKYGADWHFEYKECVTESLEDRANEDFAAELQGLYERISVLTGEAAGWSDTSWGWFAEGLGCDTDTAKQIVSRYEDMGRLCDETKVRDAASVSVILSYGGSEVSYDTWLYRVNGVLVSQELIDSALALIALIY